MSTAHPYTFQPDLTPTAYHKKYQEQKHFSPYFPANQTFVLQFHMWFPQQDVGS